LSEELKTQEQKEQTQENIHNLRQESFTKEDISTPIKVKEPEKEIEWVEKVISINRTAKVVKGGRRMAFSALVVVGNKQGQVGFGVGKANEVVDAIRKGGNEARKSLFDIILKGSTIPYQAIGHCGAARVMIKPASRGTGVIAGGAVRAVCEVAGIKDVLAKCLKSDNPVNVVRATVDALKKMEKGALRDET
jgi:small subunit ribosomal protein S5